MKHKTELQNFFAYASQSMSQYLWVHGPWVTVEGLIIDAMMTSCEHLLMNTWLMKNNNLQLQSAWQISCLRSCFRYFLILFVFTIKNFSLFISVPHFCNLHWQKLLCGYGCYPIYKRLYSKLWETSIWLSGKWIYQGPPDRSDRPWHRIEPP